MNNWNVIVVRHPGYQAFITYDEVEKILSRHVARPGSYVFRLSCTRLGQWAIGFVTAQQKILQTIPQTKSLYQALIDGAADGTYAYPNGQDHNPDITQRIQVAPEDHIKVSREQYDLYCDMETTFEMCKICDAEIKTMRIDPCGHLLCRTCLSKLVEGGATGGGTCPFCRSPIVSTGTIAITAYVPEADSSDEDELPSLPGTGSYAHPFPVPPEAQPPAGGGAREGGAPQPAGRGRGGSVGDPPPEVVADLMEMGFTRGTVLRALSVSGNDAARAVEILLTS